MKNNNYMDWQEYNARNDIYAPDMILDEYLRDIELPEFELLAPYFFNYKQYNNKGE